jgi:hypothetical protein
MLHLNASLLMQRVATLAVDSAQAGCSHIEHHRRLLPLRTDCTNTAATDNTAACNFKLLHLMFLPVTPLPGISDHMIPGLDTSS